MRIQRFLTGLAAATLVAALTATPTRADTNVFSDSGALGTFKLTNNGGGSFTLDLTPVIEQKLENINNLGVGDAGLQAEFGASVNFSLTGTVGTEHTFSSLTLTKIFRSAETGGADASLTYKIEAGSTPSSTPNAMTLTGAITGVGSTGSLLDYVQLPGATLPSDTYDFASMVGGTNTFALTSTSFGGGASSFATVLSGASGAFATGGFSAFSQAPIPEPASLAIVSVSLVGLLGYRRLGKRTPKA